MKKFDHIKADSYEQASQIIRESHGTIDPIAGGTDLLGTYKDRLLTTYPKAVVSLKNIEGSQYIKEDDDNLYIGAGTTLKTIAEDETVQKYATAVSEAAHSVASPIIRTTATIDNMK